MAGVRPRMSGNVKAKLSIEPRSYSRLKAQLKELERAVRKEIIEEALQQGGEVILKVAKAKAPGPHIILKIIGGRTLRKRIDPVFAKVVKSNGKFAAIGPDRKHWYYRFSEFGARAHDIFAKRAKTLRFHGKDGLVFVSRARNTGGVKLRPFLRPAVDSRGEEAVRVMGLVLKREIEKAAKA
jgi:HK97 gp10 family phage protein